MQLAGVEGFDRYVDYLEVHPRVRAALQHHPDHVTAFFRDEPAWDYLRPTWVPEPSSPRARTSTCASGPAGCASGQDLLDRHDVRRAMGAEEVPQRVKVYGTDAGRGGAQPGAGSPPIRRRTSRRSTAARAALLRADCRPPCVPARPGAARSSSAGTTSCRMRRSRASTSRLPQHAHVLQRRDAVERSCSASTFALNGAATGAAISSSAAPESADSARQPLRARQPECRVFAKVPQSGRHAGGARAWHRTAAQMKGGPTCPHDRCGTKPSRSRRAEDRRRRGRHAGDASQKARVSSPSTRRTFAARAGPRDLLPAARAASLIEQAYAERRTVNADQRRAALQGGEPQYSTSR